jgi:hypothetical protein
MKDKISLSLRVKTAYIICPESQRLKFSTQAPTRILILKNSLQAVTAERMSHPSTTGAE